MIVSQDGKHALCLDGGRYHGWFMYRHPDGQWVTLRRATDAEIGSIQRAQGISELLPVLSNRPYDHLASRPFVATDEQMRMDATLRALSLQGATEEQVIEVLAKQVTELRERLKDAMMWSVNPAVRFVP